MCKYYVVCECVNIMRSWLNKRLGTFVKIIERICIDRYNG